MSGTLDAVVRLAAELRRCGVDVATGDVIDAGRALAVLDLDQADQVRCGLRAVMITREPDLEVFDRVFDQVFASARGLAPSTAIEGATEGGGAGAPGVLDSRAGESLRSDLIAAVGAGDERDVRDLARRAVALFDDGDDSRSDRHVMHRIMRALDLANVLAAAMRRARLEGDSVSDLELSLRRHEIAAALEAFRRALASEVARRREAGASDVLGAVGGHISVYDRPVLELSRAELAELRRSLQPLARQLAARVGRRRRPRATGRIDLRRTIRRSLASGGIPLDPVVRRRAPHRAEVVVLCDVSGSVAEFAPFTFSLVHALHDVVAAVRSFAFVGGVAEITDVFDGALFAVPVTGILERRGVVGLDGHSDYGATFRQFSTEYLHTIGPRTTVLVTGDARSNFRDPDVEAFAAIAAVARRVYWLDPEPESEWVFDDSDLPRYRPHCDGVFEVGTVRQLADVIAELV